MGAVSASALTPAGVRACSAACSACCPCRCARWTRGTALRAHAPPPARAGSLRRCGGRGCRAGGTRWSRCTRRTWPSWSCWWQRAARRRQTQAGRPQPGSWAGSTGEPLRGAWARAAPAAGHACRACGGSGAAAGTRCRAPALGRGERASSWRALLAGGCGGRRSASLGTRTATKASPSDSGLRSAPCCWWRTAAPRPGPTAARPRDWRACRRSCCTTSSGWPPTRCRAGSPQWRMRRSFSTATWALARAAGSCRGGAERLERTAQRRACMHPCCVLSWPPQSCTARCRGCLSHLSRRNAAASFTLLSTAARRLGGGSALLPTPAIARILQLSTNISERHAGGGGRGDHVWVRGGRAAAAAASRVRPAEAPSRLGRWPAASRRARGAAGQPRTAPQLPPPLNAAAAAAACRRRLQRDGGSLRGRARGAPAAAW